MRKCTVLFVYGKGNTAGREGGRAGSGTDLRCLSGGAAVQHILEEDAVAHVRRVDENVRYRADQPAVLENG